MTYINVTIKVPQEMKDYINPKSPEEEIKRNALILYPYIFNKTISHGRAAEIMGIPKYDLIELYNNFGLAYLSMDKSEIDEELACWEKLKDSLK